MHHWNVATLCFFSLPIWIRRGSTCAPSVCSRVHRPFGLVCLITVIHVGPAAGFSIRILWYDGVKMWPFFSFVIVPLEPGHSKHTLPGWGCCSIDAESSIHSSLLTSAFSSDIIRRYKWQLLAWSLRRRLVDPHHCHRRSLQRSLIGKRCSSPCRQWMTKWWISSPVLACWSILTLNFCPATEWILAFAIQPPAHARVP